MNGARSRPRFDTTPGHVVITTTNPQETETYFVGLPYRPFSTSRLSYWI